MKHKLIAFIALLLVVFSLASLLGIIENIPIWISAIAFLVGFIIGVPWLIYEGNAQPPEGSYYTPN